jgi:hypothetical protein
VFICRMVSATAADRLGRIKRRHDVGIDRD